MIPSAHVYTYARDNCRARGVAGIHLRAAGARLSGAAQIARGAPRRCARARWGGRTAIRAPGGLHWTYAELDASPIASAARWSRIAGSLAGNRVLLRAPTARCTPPAGSP